MSISRKIFDALLPLLLVSPLSAEGESPRLLINIRDAQSELVPCRVHLTGPDGKPVRADGLPFFRDHFSCRGQAMMGVLPGDYRYEVERGPEYARQSGNLKVQPDAGAELNLQIKRISNLRDQGWYSGDLHIHRPVSDVELLMEAEDLDFGPVITWWNDQNLWRDKTIPSTTIKRLDSGRVYTMMAGEDEREGGALLYFGLKRPLKLLGSSREFPSPMLFVDQAHEQLPEVLIDIEKPFWWDVPVWLASGKVDSIGLANNHMCRRTMYESEAWGRPRDGRRLPPPRGNGFWTQEIYYHMLDAGMRIPPSAGSASGVLPNPVGYNRVYVKLDDPFSRDTWFHGLTKGRCFVTNGPLLLVSANNKHPGAVFEADAGQVSVRLQIDLITQDNVPQIEVISNGVVAKRIECSTELRQRHQIRLELQESGWFLVRAITDRKDTFRFASTAPFFVEIGDQPHRISRKSTAFFQTWVEERIERVKQNLKDESQRTAVLAHHISAREFWAKRFEEANAD